VELLTTISIIAILIAVLLPSLAMVRKMAKETKQKAQITTIGLALMAFKNDQGDYPPSERTILPPVPIYAGAQKLAEALLGRDLLGFHPDSDWDVTNDEFYPDPANQALLEASLEKRRGLYLELGTASAFKLEQLFNDASPLEPDTYVLCDTFGVRQLKLASGTSVKAGTPILYYRANTSSKNMEDTDLRKRIYNANDNQQLIELGVLTKSGVDDSGTLKHPLGWGNSTDNFYQVQYTYDTDKTGYGIIDPKIKEATNLDWPYRPDSYILISAGADGLYGTKDDITNF